MLCERRMTTLDSASGRVLAAKRSGSRIRFHRCRAALAIALKAAGRRSDSSLTERSVGRGSSDAMATGGPGTPGDATGQPLMEGRSIGLVQDGRRVRRACQPQFASYSSTEIGMPHSVTDGRCAVIPNVNNDEKRGGKDSPPSAVTPSTCCVLHFRIEPALITKSMTTITCP